MTLERAIALDDVWSGELTPVVVRGTKVVLVRLGDEVHAYEDRCPHLGVELSRGRLDGRVLTCHAHEWTYDAATGCGINPARARLKRFPVVIADGAVLLDIGGGARP